MVPQKDRFTGPSSRAPRVSTGRAQAPRVSTRPGEASRELCGDLGIAWAGPSPHLDVATFDGEARRVAGSVGGSRQSQTGRVWDVKNSQEVPGGRTVTSTKG